MGLIRGFLGGVGNAMADAGKMMFADKLQKERDEANYLRDKELNKTKQDFQVAEKQKDRDASMERTKYTADTKAKAAKDKDGSTTNIKDANALMAQGYPKDIANAVAHGAMKQIKDEDTGDMVLVNALNNTPVGRLTTVGGKKAWLPEGEQPENAEVTSEYRRAAKKAANEKAGFWRTDETDFPETGGDRKAWQRKEAQRLANEARKRKGGGLVGSQMNTETPEAPKGAGQEVKMIGNREITKQQYIDAMVKKYGADKMAEIEKQWADYK